MWVNILRLVLLRMCFCGLHVAAAVGRRLVSILGRLGDAAEEEFGMIHGMAFREFRDEVESRFMFTTTTIMRREASATPEEDAWTL